MKSQPFLSIIAPAYRESQRISLMLMDVKEFIDFNPGLVKEVIIVDDGSPDVTNTLERIFFFTSRKWVPVRFFALPENQGKWAAIREGLSHVEGDVVVLLDADGSAGAQDLLSAGVDLHGMRKGGVAFFGSRFNKYSVVEGKSVLRTVVSQVYRWYAKGLFVFVKGKGAPDDFQCPLKAFSRTDLKVPLESTRFSGDFELACTLDASIVSIPLRFIHRKGGAVRASTAWGMFWDTLRLARRIKALPKH